MRDTTNIPSAPKGLAILAIVGPAFVWCAEYIGSGEVILATRMGAILGYAALWAPLIGIVLKTCIGAGGAHYTVCTGEGMIDMFSRLPGRGNWAVWIVLIAQLLAGAISIGGVASAAGVFAHSLVPLQPFVWGWIITIFAILVVWSGVFDLIKYVMSVFVFVVVLGVLYVSIRTFPGIDTLLSGFTGFRLPAVPEWALAYEGVSPDPWREVLPLMGWAAGGFASQVWYTYWVLGAGYGMARDRGYGKSCDVHALGSMSADIARRVRGWVRVVYVDATVAMIIGIVVTGGFMLSGAGVLGPSHVAPSGPEVAIELSAIFGEVWGRAGATLFVIAGCAALISTLTGQFAGWPRLLADSLRICVPGFSRKLAWRSQFRLMIGFFLVTNLVIVYSLGIRPVSVIQLGAVVEGVLLTPFQAVAVLIGLYWILPRLLSAEARKYLKPGWILTTGLILAAVAFSCFGIFVLLPFL